MSLAPAFGACPDLRGMSASLDLQVLPASWDHRAPRDCQDKWARRGSLVCRGEMECQGRRENLGCLEKLVCQDLWALLDPKESQGTLGSEDRRLLVLLE